MKFTPGPWEVDSCDPCVVLTQYETSDPDDSFVAMTMPDSTTGLSVGTARAYANAQLIAGAPDLLKALQDIVCHETIGNAARLEQARAAIAKATVQQ